MRRPALTLGILVLATTACGPHAAFRGKRTQMMLADSAPTGENITPVNMDQRVYPSESIANFEMLRNITQSDLDAARRTPSRGVTYVPLGTSVRPAEGRE